MTSSGLFGSTTLDVVIGLIFVYLLLAIICTNLNEWIAGVFDMRASTLSAAIKQLLDGQPEQAGSPDVDWFLQQFYQHPVIVGMKKPGDPTARPAYIAPRAFAATVLDIVTRQKPGVIDFQDLETGINNLPPGDVKTSLLAVIQTSNRDIQQAQRAIEAWYEDTMQRVSGWYKKRTQLWTVIVASVLTLGVNADTLQIVKTLWQDPTLRAQLVEQSKNPAAASIQTKLDLNSLSEVVGWSHQSLPKTKPGWIDKVLGWLLSIVAISLGAPFWFDLLNKFMRVRNGGDAPEERPTAPQNPVPAAPAATRSGSA